MAREYLVCKDAGEVSRRGAELLIRLAREKADAGGRLSVALSGGSTPKTMFEILAGDLRDQVPWESIDFFWGDERTVPPDHKDSNYRMTREAMLDQAPVPPGNIYRIPAEGPDAGAAAVQYQQTIREYFGLADGELPSFDLIYLGMGDDGHTASLFPGTKALGETRSFVTSNYVDKFSTYRITLTAAAINRGKTVAFLIAGGGKSGRVKEVFEGPSEPDRLPSQMIQPSAGRLLIIIDTAASSELSDKGGH